jgi:hypothetical protein
VHEQKADQRDADHNRNHINDTAGDVGEHG